MSAFRCMRSSETSGAERKPAAKAQAARPRRGTTRRRRRSTLCVVVLNVDQEAALKQGRQSGLSKVVVYSLPHLWQYFSW